MLRSVAGELRGDLEPSKLDESVDGPIFREAMRADRAVRDGIVPVPFRLEHGVVVPADPLGRRMRKDDDSAADENRLGPGGRVASENVGAVDFRENVGALENDDSVLAESTVERRIFINAHVGHMPLLLFGWITDGGDSECCGDNADYGEMSHRF